MPDGVALKPMVRGIAPHASHVREGSRSRDGHDRKRQIEEALYSLNRKEAGILRRRFGIGMESPMTLEEIGREFNVTRERIRQIEVKALRKLKHPSRSNVLKDFLESS